MRETGLLAFIFPADGLGPCGLFPDPGMDVVARPLQLFGQFSPLFLNPLFFRFQARGETPDLAVEPVALLLETGQGLFQRRFLPGPFYLQVVELFQGFGRFFLKAGFQGKDPAGGRFVQSGLLAGEIFQDGLFGMDQFFAPLALLFELVP